MYLPVSMVENLLVDPQVIFKAMETVRHKTSFQTPDDVATSLDSILDELSDHEVSRRVKAAVASRTLRIQDPVAEARRQVEEFAAAVLSELSQEYFERIAGQASEAVLGLKAAVRRRELYDGKRIIDEFFKRHLHDSGMSKEVFVYLCAKEASSRHSVAQFIQALFTTLGILPPPPGAA
jgi:hypothetical protein